MPFTRALELGRPHPVASSVADADGITAEPVASHRGKGCFQWTGRAVRGSRDEAASEANGRGAGRPEARDAEEASPPSSPGGALRIDTAPHSGLGGECPHPLLGCSFLRRASSHQRIL